MKQNLKIVVLLLFLIHFSLILEAQSVILGVSPVGELNISGTGGGIAVTSYTFVNYEFKATSGDIEKGKDLILKFDVRNCSNQNGSNVKIIINNLPENVYSKKETFEVSDFSANSTDSFEFKFIVRTIHYFVQNCKY